MFVHGCHVGRHLFSSSVKKSVLLSGKSSFYVKNPAFLLHNCFFYNYVIVKKTAFLHKKAVFLQIYIFLKKQLFYNYIIALHCVTIYYIILLQLYNCKKAAFSHRSFFT